MRIAWNVRLRGMPAAATSGRGDRVLDDVRELGRRLDRTRDDDGLCDASGEALVTEAREDIRELLLGIAIDDVGRGEVAVGIHPHVEGSVVAVAEATLATIELR